MSEVETRVELLETTFQQYMANSDAMARRLDKNIERLDRNYERMGKEMVENRQKWDREFEELKEEHRRHAREMARIAERIGRFAEDIVAPNIPRIARESFGISQIDFAAQRIDKRSTTAPGKLREFDNILAGQGKLIVVEVKSTTRLKYVDDFAETAKEIFDYFPEYRGFSVIPIFAALDLGGDFLRRLTRLKIYGMALANCTMELINFDEVNATGGKSQAD